MIDIMIPMTWYSIWYILSGFRQKNLLCPHISWKFGNFNDQNNKCKQKCMVLSIMWLKWMIGYVSYNLITKVLIQPIYRDSIQCPNADSPCLFTANKFHHDVHASPFNHWFIWLVSFNSRDLVNFVKCLWCWRYQQTDTSIIGTSASLR